MNFALSALPSQPALCRRGQLRHHFSLSSPRPVSARARALHPIRASVSVEREVNIQVEKPSGNVRILRAVVDINAPLETVWGCLTNYDGLGDFVPSLAVNEVVERASNGAKLLQVGEQDVAFGLRFSAKVTLECTEFPTGFGVMAPRAAKGCLGESLEQIPDAEWEKGKLVKDIAFVLVEGDFQAFSGVWRMQEGGKGPSSTRLSYIVYVSPMAWLPVGLIQSRIEKDMTVNLRAVADYAEKRAIDQVIGSASETD